MSEEFTDRPLCEIAPRLRSIWLRLFEKPTPIRRLANLGDALGHSNLWIKEDQHTHPHCGGFKVRKLELLLGRAFALGAKRILSFGARGGSHAFATSFFSNQVGLQTTLFLSNQVLPLNSLASYNYERLCEADSNLVSVPIAIRVFIEFLAKHAPLCIPRDTYVIPSGGSSPLGCLGAVNAALELLRQIRGSDMPVPHEIYVPAGSCGTAVGLNTGLRLLGIPCRVKAVAVASRLFASRSRIESLANSTLALLSQYDCSFTPSDDSDVELLGGYAGDGYGIPSREGIAASALLRLHEDIYLDDTYTAKAMAAFLARSSATKRNQIPLLFWNTCAKLPD